MTYLIPLPGYTKPPLSLNVRMHWAPKAKATKALRNLTHTLARQHEVPAMERATVTFHYRPADNRTRDHNNLSPNVKACTDGLVDAGVLTNGDGSEYVEERCVIERAEKGVPAALWLSVEEVNGDAS